VDALGYAEALAARCRAALGEELASAILHGSLVLGDFVPGRSDIDVLVIVREPLVDEQLAAVMDAAGAPPARVDLRVVTRATAAAPPRTPVLEAGVVLRPASDPELDARAAPEPDVAVELSVARAHGRGLAGAAPDAVIGPIPPEWLDEIGDRRLAAWQEFTDDDEHAELMVLTACRIWRFALERAHCSKRSAGRWALTRDPSLVAVEQALLQVTPIAPGEIARVLAVVRAQLRPYAG
jgi:Nucleotidyltransferase domain/Domain of unknown function (DUF4111)